jgi:hypothetical protein
MHGKHVCAALLLLAASAAGAQPWLSKEDCDVLAKSVTRHVWLAATEPRLAASARAGTADLGGTERRICRFPAEVTTRAFGEALAAFNLAIGWEPPDPGDYCLSGDLEQCYPNVAPEPRVSAGQLAFVYEAWQGVRAAVRSFTPAGSGAAVFTADALDAALRTELGASVATPLYARPVR